MRLVKEHRNGEKLWPVILATVEILIYTILIKVGLSMVGAHIGVKRAGPFGH